MIKYPGVKTKEANIIIVNYQIHSFLTHILSALYAPISIYFRGQMFKADELSFLLLLTSSIGLIQFLMNKVSATVSLFLSVIFNLIASISFVIVLNIYGPKTYVIVSMVVVSIVQLFTIHYKGVMDELMKNDIEIQKISNTSITIMTVSNLIGLSSGSVVFKYITPENYVQVLTLIYIGFISLDIYELFISTLIYKWYIKPYEEKKLIANSAKF